MGGENSTRRITVEEGDGPGMVKISDSVVRRLRGEQETGSQSEKPVVPEKAKFRQQTAQPPGNNQLTVKSKQLETEYLQKLQALQHKNEEVYDQRVDEFNQAVNEVEQKFIHQTTSPVCLDLEQEVLKCYQLNGKQTLLCSAQVKAFLDCVENSRQRLLNKRG